MRKMKRWEVRLAIILVLALVWNLIPTEPEVATAASGTSKYVTAKGSIPLNTQTTVSIERRIPDVDSSHYSAYSFTTTGEARTYYHFIWSGSDNNYYPEYYITDSLDYDDYKHHSNTMDNSYSIGDVGGGGNNLLPNTTYYILFGGRTDSVINATVSVMAYVDPEADTASGAETIEPGVEYYKKVEGVRDTDVYVFDTGDNTYNLVGKTDDRKEGVVGSVNLHFYKDAECTQRVDYYMLSKSELRTVDLKNKLAKNTRYYLKTEFGNGICGIPVGYTFKLEPQQAVSPTPTPSAKPSASPSASPKPSSTPSASPKPSATPTASAKPTTSPGSTWTVDPGRDGYTAAETNTDGYTVGKIDSTKDQDVLYFDTGDYVYSMDFYGDNQVYFEIYSDIDLRDFVYYVLVNSNTVYVDLSKELKTNTRYYIRIISKEDEEVGPQGYEILTHKTQASSSSSTSTKKKKMNYTKYLKKYKYVTNRYSNVTGEIKGKKITFKKNKNGYICWMNFSNGNGGSRYLTNKSGEMKKKKYTYKIAKGCKVIYDADADGKKATIKSKKWFNKKFNKKWPQGSSWAEFGVFLNKKNKVVLIFSGDMLGAWQT